MGHTQNQNQPFLAEIKKQIISFQKLPTLSKYNMQRLNLQNFFWQKRVIFTPAKTTIAASQLYLLGIKQRDARVPHSGGWGEVRGTPPPSYNFFQPSTPPPTETDSPTMGLPPT